MADWERELAFAHELADRAAEVGVEVFHREFEVRRKADDSPVTEADTRIEAMLREAIAARFPGDAIVGVGGWLGRRDRAAFLTMCEEVDRVRGFGDFWGHVLVARGACDAMMETSLRTWDFAALEVIVEEAGGSISQVDGSPLADGK